MQHRQDFGMCLFVGKAEILKVLHKVGRYPAAVFDLGFNTIVPPRLISLFKGFEALFFKQDIRQGDRFPSRD